MMFYKEKIRIISASIAFLFIIAFGGCSDSPKRLNQKYVFYVKQIEYCSYPDKELCDYWIEGYDVNFGNRSDNVMGVVIRDSIGKYKIGEQLEFIHRKK